MAKCYNAKDLKSIFATHEKKEKEAIIRESLRQKIASLPMSICVFWWNVERMLNILQSLSWFISDEKE